MKGFFNSIILVLDSHGNAALDQMCCVKHFYLAEQFNLGK